MNYSKSQRLLRINPKYIKLALKQTDFPENNRHPSSVLLLNFPSSPKEKSSNNLLGFASDSYNNSDLKRKKLYDNIHIFHKRQYVFNKNLETKKKVFKYKNFILFGEKNRLSRNQNRMKRKKIDNEIDYSKFLLSFEGNTFPILNTKNITSDIIKKQSSYINKPKKHTRIFNMINNILNKNKSSKPEKNNIDKKLNIYTNIRNSELVKSKYMPGLRTFLTNKLTLKEREEKLQIMKENNQEKIENLTTKISTLKKSYYNFGDNFCKRFSEYVREILLMKEELKIKDDIYVDKLIKLKNIVNTLKSTVRKIEINRNSLNHWMYLQICLKEKKLNLPKSYKDILESNYEDNDLLIKKYGKNLVEKVKNYRNNIIYKSAEEFLNQFNILEKNNLELLNKHQIIREQIRKLENERNKLMYIFNPQEYDEEFKGSISKAINEINKLKNVNITLLESIDILKNKKIESKFNDDNGIKKSLKLYDKTQKILLNIKRNVDFPFEINTSNKKPNQLMILHNLSNIENAINILNKKNEIFKEVYPEKMNKLKIIFEKEKKYKKGMEQMNKMITKLEENRKDLYKKYQKIFLLPTHKLYIFDTRNKNKSNVREHKSKNRKKRNKSFEDIDDYLSY